MQDITTIFTLLIIIIIVVGVIAGIVTFLLNKKRRQLEQSDQYKLTFLQVKVPPSDESEIKVAESLFSSLMGISSSNASWLLKGHSRVSFEIVSNTEGISFYVVAPDDIAVLVEKQINGAYPDAEIDIIDPQEVWDRGEYTSVAELRLSGPHYYPIKTYESLGSDSLSGITTAMSKLKPDEVLALQVIIKPAGDFWRDRGSQYIYDVKNKASATENSAPVDQNLVQGIEKKISKPGFYTTIRVISIAKDRFSAESNVTNLTNAFEQFTDPTFNRLTRKSVKTAIFIDDFIYRRPNFTDIRIPGLGWQIKRNTSVLNIEELATIFHFPNKNVKTPSINWLRARKSSAPINLPTDGLYLGQSLFRGVSTDVYIKDKDRRRHMYIIGQTGTGKSEFLKGMALQDIVNGEGLAIIDPHGSAVDDIMQKIPRERAEDVVLFNASDTEMPIGLNVLEWKDEREKNIIINAFIGLLKKLYDPNNQGVVGPKLERAVRNVMLTAMYDKDSTLIDVLRLLIDSEYSKKFFPLIKDPLVMRYWTDEVAKTSDFHKSETMGYFVSKFDRFITERSMRNMLGQPHSSLDFEYIMENKKILLVDLSKGKIGEENSTFLGLIIVPRILTAALKRAQVLAEGGDFPDFYLYVDEFQNFATPDFATILSEARKYKLDLIVANQFIGQLTEGIKDAIFGNVGTLVSFRVGIDDADYLEKQFEPTFMSNDLLNNAMGNCYMRLLIDGHPSEPFSMRVDWDADRDDISTKYVNIDKNIEMARYIRQLSRQKYGKYFADVEAFIQKRAGFDTPPQMPEPPKPKRRRPAF
ncbi:MAG: type IV secretory system conjugative DNA transfer family protein [Patescibacteria group bacterium]